MKTSRPLFGDPSATEQRPARMADRPIAGNRAISAERPVHGSRAIAGEPPAPLDLRGLYPFQQEGVRWLHRRVRALLADSMGLGKLQHVDCKVLTPTGWRKIGDLAVGDAVCDPDGGVAFVEGVFPQGECDLFRVTMKDGGSTEAGGEHLWAVSTATDRLHGKPLRVVDTNYLRPSLKMETNRPGQPNSRWFVPVTKVVTFDDPGPLPIAPYLLGVLLGDGCLSKHGVRFTNPDEEILERLKPLLPPGITANLQKDRSGTKCPTWGLTKSSGDKSPNILLDQIRSLGLSATLSIHKHVPPQYLRASAADRLLLLQGLMDTDGDVTSAGHCTANTSSPQLKDGIVDLVRSLGGTASVNVKLEPKFTYRGEVRTGATAYRVNVTLRVCPFLLKRKADRWIPPRVEKARAIESIEPSRRGECVCIRVSSKRSLYVTDDYIVTHNTMQCLRALSHGQGTIVVCPASLRLNWVREIAKWRPDLSVALSGNIEYVREQYPVLEARTFEPGTLPQPHSNEVVIVSYEGLPEIPDTPKPNWLVPVGLGDVTLVADEAHRLKNPNAQRTKKWRLLAKQVRRIWLLTGTPMEGKPEDLWGVLESGRLFKAVFKDKAGFYAAFGGERGEGGYGWKFPPEPVADIASMLRPVMLRRLKKDVLPDLPSKVRTDLTVEVSPAMMKELDALDAAWTASGDDLPPIELWSAVRVRLARDRIDAVREHVQQYEEEGTPIVVFCSHVEPLQALVGGDMLEPREGWACITGAIPQKLRDTYVALFQEGLLRGLAVSSKAGGVGITLTKASHCLFVDLAVTPSENEQCEDRLVRIGQEASSVQVTRMVANHAVDRRILEILGGKETMIDATLGEKE